MNQLQIVMSKFFKWLLCSLLFLLGLSCVLIVSPRVWSLLYPDKPPVGYHFIAPTFLAAKLGLEEIINQRPQIPSDVEEIKNIEYKNVNGQSLQLDFYKPVRLNKPAPLLVFIHGGGWRSGERSDYLVYLVAFAKKGYITATVSYRLLRDATYPACAEDITDAVLWFFENGENYGYDPNRIALIGGSAGAHLALLAAYGWRKPLANRACADVQAMEHRIKAVVDIYGPIDLTTQYARDQPLVTSLMAHSFEESPGLYREASPINYLDKSDPPTLILHGTSDDLVPISQSDLLKAKLDSLGVPVVYCRVPLWPHTMDVVQRVNNYSQLKMSDFFNKYLK